MFGLPAATVPRVTLAKRCATLRGVPECRATARCGEDELLLVTSCHVSFSLFLVDVT
jgi:hypothetical protein